MSRKKHDSKTNRDLVRQRKRDDERREVPEDLGRRTVQGVLIDESKWEGHDL